MKEKRRQVKFAHFASGNWLLQNLIDCIISRQLVTSRGIERPSTVFTDTQLKKMVCFLLSALGKGIYPILMNVSYRPSVYPLACCSFFKSIRKTSQTTNLKDMDQYFSAFAKTMLPWLSLCETELYYRTTHLWILSHSHTRSLKLL
jgi:hypothetical protein